ncbi:MAG: RNA polymerase factor sigma-54 [Bacteriovoracaceae bacterium]
MAIKMNQSLKQTQTLTMTPQLQQAIKLLTLTHLEMTTVISQEMVENPMLEEIEDAPEEVTAEIEASTEATADDFNSPEMVENSKDQFDWDAYADSMNNNSSTPPSMVSTDPDDQMNYENMVTSSATLPEHLEWQLRMENLTEEEWNLAREIIHNLNEDGFLELPFDEILVKSPLEREDAFEILKMIHQLDPVGCGSRNMEECLMIQARNLEERAPLVELLISNHMTDLQKKDYANITKVTGVSREKIKDAELIIASFNPKPGRLIGGEETHYVVPDIYVVQVGDEFVVQLNDEGVPRLKISNLYKSMLKKGQEGEAQEFVQDKLRAAMWLIKSIENRQKTIVKVSEALVRYQPEFFKKGPQFLRPMILKDIAMEIGMHESTVSRVTTNKYMHTPIGTFELKYFFNAGIGGDKGGIDIAGETLKLKIKGLIEKENAKKPLSDQKIVELLANEDIVVARRTVAKYREMMNIASSSTRKKE